MSFPCPAKVGSNFQLTTLKYFPVMSLCVGTSRRARKEFYGRAMLCWPRCLTLLPLPAAHVLGSVTSVQLRKFATVPRTPRGQRPNLKYNFQKPTLEVSQRVSNTYRRLACYAHAQVTHYEASHLRIDNRQSLQESNVQVFLEGFCPPTPRMQSRNR